MPPGRAVRGRIFSATAKSRANPGISSIFTLLDRYDLVPALAASPLRSAVYRSVRSLYNQNSSAKLVVSAADTIVTGFALFPWGRRRLGCAISGGKELRVRRMAWPLGSLAHWRHLGYCTGPGAAVLPALGLWFLKIWLATGAVIARGLHWTGSTMSALAICPLVTLNSATCKRARC